MRLVLKVFVAFALTASVAFAQADPPGRVARLNHVLGAVSFAPAGAPDQWTQAVINRPLTGGDRLWADREARGEFHVGSTAVRLAPLTSLDVLYLDDDRMQLRLAQGTANIRVRDLDFDDLVEIATPAGAVIVRQAGSYRISVDPRSDVVRVVVNFGQAEVVTPHRSFAVPTGQTAVVNAFGLPVFEIAQASSDDFDRWSAERDRREDRIESTRYVSPHMTGHEDLDAHGTWRTVPEYGAVWVPARVERGWAPYRHGHWSWISPWGWTWVDDAPWGFAPFHYGRWVMVHDHWAWAPGAIQRRPVYAPALVAFVGGSSWGVSLRSGPAVGWFPLGWREPYRPWYRASHAHTRNVNVTHVTHVTNVYNTTHVTHVHRHRAEAVTVVPQQAFVSARSVGASRVSVAQGDLATAQLIQDRPPANPGRASVAPERPGQRPPPQAAAREVVAVSQPAAGARNLPREPGSAFTRSADEPRVRVLGRERDDARRAQGDLAQESRGAGARVPASEPSSPGVTLTNPAAARTAAESTIARPPAPAATVGSTVAPQSAGAPRQATTTPIATPLAAPPVSAPAARVATPTAPAQHTAPATQLPSASAATPAASTFSTQPPASALAARVATPTASVQRTAPATLLPSASAATPSAATFGTPPATAPVVPIAPATAPSQPPRLEMRLERTERRRDAEPRGDAQLERAEGRRERPQQRAEAASSGPELTVKTAPAVRETPARGGAAVPVVPSVSAAAATPASVLPSSAPAPRAQRPQQHVQSR